MYSALSEAMDNARVYALAEYLDPKISKHSVKGSAKISEYLPRYRNLVEYQGQYFIVETAINLEEQMKYYNVDYTEFPSVDIDLVFYYEDEHIVVKDTFYIHELGELT